MSLFREHQQYGFCQAGTSGILLEDEAVLGVPGPFTWRGTVHTSNISDDFLHKDKTQYFGPLTEVDSPVYKYSYLGEECDLCNVTNISNVFVMNRIAHH